LGALGTAASRRADQPVRQTPLGLAVARFVSERETTRPLLTLGEILQLLVDDALVLVSGVPLIRSQELRYYANRNFIVSPLAAANLASVRPSL
jgi:type IV secretion system protein VirD4